MSARRWFELGEWCVPFASARSAHYYIGARSACPSAYSRTVLARVVADPDSRRCCKACLAARDAHAARIAARTRRLVREQHG